MNRSSFKRFEFFDVDTLASDVSSTLGSTPTCAAAEGGMLMFGDKFGYLILADRNFHVTAKHKLFRGEVKGIAYLYDPTSLNNRQHIVVLGDDSQPHIDGSDSRPPPMYFVKIFALTDFVRPLHVLNATVNDAILTCFAVLSDGYQIAAGYDNGAVVLFSGRFLQEVSNTPVRNSAYTVLQTSHNYPVTSLHFCEVQSKRSADRRIRLFAVMNTPELPPVDLSGDKGPEGDPNASFQRPPDPGMNGDDPKFAGVLIFDTSVTSGPGAASDFVAGPRHNVRVLDERGAPAKCATFMRGLGELVVARSEAVYNYSIEDRGGALAISGDKLCICAVGRYTLVVSVEERTAVPVVAAVGLPSHNLDGEMPTYLKPKRPVVNIYDLKNKIICGTAKKFQLQLNEKVLYALNDGGVVYLITTAGAMIRFREKDTHRKLDVLLSQTSPPLYSLAIMLAAEEQLEPAEIMKLYKRYGDHLYEEKDFDGSIVQYSHTIGYIPSSSVITKFLDPYRISNLIAYLEKLHSKNLAASDHITLLLSCYTKIKDDGQINSLLDAIALNPNIKSVNKSGGKGGSGQDTSAAGNLFNAEQAISILHSAGYTVQALKVAARYHQHRAYIDIQMKKSPPLYDDVLGYLAYLPFVASSDEILYLLRLHGRSLSKNRAVVFTALLVKLCTGDYASLLPSTQPGALKGQKGDSKSTKDHNRSSRALTAITTADVLKAFTHLLPESIVIPTERLSIVEVMYLFSADDSSLLTLLEGFVEASPGRILPAKVSTTLMELYLHKHSKLSEQLRALKHGSHGSAGVSQTELESSLQSTETQVMGLLDGAHTQYDPAHALLLCHSFAFERGQRYLLERQQSTELLMRMLIDKDDVKEVFKVLRREGSKDPQLFVQVLTYFVQQSIAPEDSPARGKGEEKRAGGARERRSSHSEGSEGSAGSDEGSAEEDDSSEDEDDDEDRWNYVMDVMDLIEKEAVLSPLQVLSILALNPKLPLHVASNYMSGILKTLSESNETVKGEVQSAMTDIEAISYTRNANNQMSARAIRQQERAQRRQQQRNAANVHRIGIGANTSAKNNNNNNNNTYGDELLSSEDEEEEETEEQERLHRASREEYWLSLRNSFLECATKHETFFNKLAHNPDGFNVVVEHFGRSIIS